MNQLQDPASLAAGPPAISRLPRTAEKWNALLLCCIAVAVKCIVYLIDARPALFMGDSGSYLATASINYIPPDRSFVFGYLLKWIALWPHSLETVVQTQVAFSAISCCVLGWLLLRHFRISLPLSAILVSLCAIEPLQLLSERYVLTEATATLLFALHVWTAFAYCRRGSFWLLLLQAGIGVLLISIRIGYLPLVLFSSLLLPLLSPVARSSLLATLRHRAPPLRKWVPVALSLLLSVAATQCLLRGYQLLYGSLFNPKLRPAFLYNDGYFLLSDFAPLVTPDDYPVPQDRAWVFSHTTVPLKDRRAREPQRWMAGGICTVIEHVPGQSEFHGNRLARLTALHAIRRNPLGAVRLILGSVADYFDKPYLMGTILTDEAIRLKLSPHDASYFRDFYGFSRKPDDDNTLTRRWHRLLWPWYPALILIPVLYLITVVLLRRSALAIHWYLLLPAAAVWATAAITISRPTPRFETSLAWLTFLLIGSVLNSSLYFRAGPSRLPCSR